jgi:predicted amidohydrolase YtcJ
MRPLFRPAIGAATLCLSTALSTVLSSAASGQEIADRLYSGGTILTMDDSAPRAEALATKDGRILAVGTLSEVEAHQGETTQRYDLDGRALLPGFVDSHGHVVMGGLQALSANLLAPPDGTVTDIASLQEALRGWIADNQEAIAASNLIVGFGYDQSQLAERRHPTKADLDAVSQDVPIILVHQSGHFGAVNSAALAANDITKRTPVPPGGVIRYGADGEPDGVLEENAFFMVLGKMLGGIGDEGFKAFARAGAKLWASFGYTTAQEGRATPQVAEIARAVAAEGGMAVDVVVYPDVLVDREFILANHSSTYENGVRIGGAKLTIDGSPQGFTALRDRPYFDPVGSYPPGYAGYASATPEQVQDAISWAFDHDIQILTHANGEGASDMLLAAIDAAEKTHGAADRRPVLIHGQFLRPDQVAALDRLDVFPSLFPMHTFYWGDWHRDHTVGPVNAENISPTGWVRARGMMFGTHHDAPVAFPDSMRVLSATVTRRTRSGDILGPHQRVDVMTALKAMTLWPAYQHFEEAEKGSLTAGKLADFVLLSDDPTAVDPEALDQLKVLATIKADAEIYRAEDGPQKARLVPPVGHHVLDIAHVAARQSIQNGRDLR